MFALYRVRYFTPLAGDVKIGGPRVCNPVQHVSTADTTDYCLNLRAIGTRYVSTWITNGRLFYLRLYVS